MIVEEGGLVSSSGARLSRAPENTKEYPPVLITGFGPPLAEKIRYDVDKETKLSLKLRTFEGERHYWSP